MTRGLVWMARSAAGVLAGLPCANRRVPGFGVGFGEKGEPFAARLVTLRRYLNWQQNWQQK